jgi:hypothetical protein
VHFISGTSQSSTTTYKMEHRAVEVFKASDCISSMIATPYIRLVRDSNEMVYHYAVYERIIVDDEKFHLFSNSFIAENLMVEMSHVPNLSRCQLIAVVPRNSELVNNSAFGNLTESVSENECKWLLGLNSNNQLVLDVAEKDAEDVNKTMREWVEKKKCVLNYRLDDYGLSFIAAVVLALVRRESVLSFKALAKNQKKIILECKKFLDKSGLLYNSSYEQVAGFIDKPLIVANHVGKIIFTNIPNPQRKESGASCVSIVQSVSGKYFPLGNRGVAALRYKVSK